MKYPANFLSVLLKLNLLDKMRRNVTALKQRGTFMSEKYQMPITAIALLNDRNSTDIQLIEGRQEIPLTFKDFTSIYNWPNMGSLRKMAFESDNNGLASFCKIQKAPFGITSNPFQTTKGRDHQKKQTMYGKLVQVLIQNLLILNEIRLRMAYGSIHEIKNSKSLGATRLKSLAERED